MSYTFDIYKQINYSTDIEFLKKLLEYVDIDISNIGNESDIMKKYKETISNKPIEEIYKKQLIGFTEMKKKIQERILFLTK